ncbi:Cytoplasmic and mitochondrial histidine tRNA synthetase [Brettanomyces nanus]|uniref:Histidine--tRNA ligase, mitochondrial n=1 Tax=Eeniella nana TaxID=13502 RepID=A0A875RXQ9_EENNA|nr:Cytoplasmic and mitochondrial histidine tRNA synthetase [Brettanomyces nanus]QPG73866.1 Cytoplasmic and mitochondrial histidine tRNA synthetase [Brettanomyces nanus]
MSTEATKIQVPITTSVATATATSSASGASEQTHEHHSKKNKKAHHFNLKVPKGTKDWADKDMVIREAIFEKLVNLFRSHGGVTIDTPVLELREILEGKYGEDSKLIYNLEDQGGELTSLRYDLTVPFARYVAMNGITNIKRYHIAKVYRRDQPAMTKGRMREFYQCDFDVAGSYDSMVPDAEMLKIVSDGLHSLGINEFKIKLNHRKILDGIFEVCGVKDEDVRKVSSAVDKLDKLPWEVVKKEMCEEKNQPEDVADKIGEYVKLHGHVRDLLAILKADDELMANESANTGITEIETMADYLEAFNIESCISFDMSLARGLDYYTGVIYECVTEQSAPPKDAAKKKAKAKAHQKEEDASEYVGIGSIAAGGRYDKLVGMFLGTNSKGKKAPSIPCVGVSFGVERIFSLIKQRASLVEKIRPVSTQVYVMAFGGGKDWHGFLPERMQIASKLWEAGIETEYLYKAKVNPRKQFDAAEKSGCPLAVILGKEEFPEGKIRIKKLGTGLTDEGDLVSVDNIVEEVKKRLSEVNEDGVDQVSKLLQDL